MAEYFFLSFYHRGQFLKTDYVGGACTKIPTEINADTFSFPALMEYVKDDVGYTEIGGVYVKKVGGGWKIVSNDADVTQLVQGLTDGASLDLYIDTIVDKTIEPVKQLQPHVIIRPRTSFFEGKDLQLKRKFVTLQGLRQEQREKKKLANDGKQVVTKNSGQRAEVPPIAGPPVPPIVGPPVPPIAGPPVPPTGAAGHKRQTRRNIMKENANVEAGNAKSKEASPEIADYEERRRRRAEENKKFLDQTGLKKKADELFAKTKNKKTVLEEEWATCDREYVPGHDSLSNSEEGEAPKQTTKVRVVKAAMVPSTRSTRSQTLQKAARTQVMVEENLPPPPPLPTDLQPFQQLKRADNDGIGTMAAYLSLRKSQQEKKETHINHDHNDEAADGNGNGDDIVALSTEKTKSTRRRGPTKMSAVFTRKLEDRPVLTLNHELQPVSENSKIRSEYSSFLGTLARQCVPLDYISWHEVPDGQKNGWWEFIKTKYIIPEEGKDWSLRTMAELWRIHKSRFKVRYYTKYHTDEDRLKNRPQSIPLEKFKVLLKYWGDESVQTKAEKNIVNRKKVADTHTAGRTSFAQIGNEMKKKNASTKTPTKGQIYPKTRKGHNTEGEGSNGIDARNSGDEGREELGEVPELNFAAHGPNWLVGRSGRTRKSKKDMSKIDNKNSAQLKQLRDDLASEMEDKMNQKLEKILGKLAEQNPSLNINVKELCATTYVEDGDETDAYEGEEEVGP